MINLWITAAVVLLLFWPHVIMVRTPSLREEQLISLSSQYRGINGRLLKYVMAFVVTIGLAIVAFLGLTVLAPQLLRPIGLGYVTLLVSSYSLFQASFAIRYRVMPNSKFYGSLTTYWYSDSGLVRRVATIQIGLFVLVLVGVAVYSVVIR